MWLQRLAVTAFGPLVDQELELAPGLNVIHGANESAKSTWHAALTVGLCGRRRGAGRRAEDAAFEARHRPWDGDERWGTTLRLQLLDERVIEIRRDLVQGRAQVVDVGLGGRPIADDLIVDGTPDGSAWLGLDRSSFPATASVRQAQLLEVAAHADALREHLARAATGGAGVTAAAALQRLIAFQRERVGVDKANAVKPLRRAIDARAHARHRLDEVQSAHRNFLVLLGEAEEGRREVAAARQQVASIEAALAVEAADAAERRLNELEALAAEFPDGPPTGDAPALLRDAMRVVERAAALGPEPVTDLSELADLQRSFAEIPEEPIGPVEVPADVQERFTEFRAAIEAVRAVSSVDDESDSSSAAHDSPSSSPEVEPAPMVDPVAVQRLTEVLQRPEPPALEGLESEVRELELRQEEAERSRRQRAHRVRLAGAIAAVACLALLVPSTLLRVGGAGVLLTAVAGASWFARRPIVDVHAELEARRRDLADRSESLERDEAARTEARHRLGALGLPSEPDAALAVAIDRQLAARRRSESHRRALEARHRADARRAAVLDALAQHGIDSADPIEGVAALRAECRARAEQARLAAERPRVQRLIQERTAFDDLLSRHRVAVADHQAELHRVAKSSGLDPDAANVVDQLGSLIDGWQRDARDRQRRHQQWGQLQNALGGLALEDHRSRLDMLRQEVEAALAASHGERSTEPDPPRAMVRAQRALDEARARLDRATGGLERIEPSSVDVAAAEASVEAADEELVRVRRLQATLETTRSFLDAAHEQAHRALAPRIEAEMSAWVPVITGGRYRGATVDPETLAITLLGEDGRHRDARLVSHGTAEQVHLVLRLVLAELLTADHEPCPVLLDDPTVHFDELRTVEVLEYLREASRRHQVVVFSQEPAVRDWAEGRLDPDIDRLVHLDPAGTAEPVEDGPLSLFPPLRSVR